MPRLAKLTTCICACAVICAVLATSALAAYPSRAVPLRALSAAMKSHALTTEAQNLCGITRLCGYLVDADSSDIVLLGVVDPHQPALHLDDFVVAYRNVQGAYNRVSGRVQYDADPGCSIDPNPTVLAQLRDLNRSYGGANNDEALKIAL